MPYGIALVTPQTFTRASRPGATTGPGVPRRVPRLSPIAAPSGYLSVTDSPSRAAA
jgi:hypothetical protein